ncbi:hypothetical protein GEMRC1_012993 [Eukaryota sp. GEM-RC1]
MTSVRFELPFSFHCLGTNDCPQHLLGKGTRFTAVKTSTGHYYSTPILLFTMKCHICGNQFQLQTNPQKSTYDIISGAKPTVTSLQSPSSHQSPFQKLEETVSIQQRQQTTSSSLRQLMELSDRQSNITDCLSRISAHRRLHDSINFRKHLS